MALVLIMVVIPTAYMTAFYMARPVDPVERLEWMREIYADEQMGKRRFFGKAVLFNEWLYETFN